MAIPFEHEVPPVPEVLAFLEALKALFSGLEINHFVPLGELSDRPINWGWVTISGWTVQNDRGLYRSGDKLDYNPHTARFALLTQKVQETREKITRHRQEINWYNGFTPDEASSTLAHLNREVASIPAKLSALDVKTRDQAIRVCRLKDEASIGLNPFYWFSDEREAKKRQHAVALEEFRILTVQENTLKSRLEALRSEIAQLQRDQERHRAFNCLETQAIVATLAPQLQALETELADVAMRKAQTDQLLQEPLAELRKLEETRKRLEAQIAKAKGFQAALDKAANSGQERRKIHERCEAELGDSKPGRFLVTAQREFESVRRNIGKLEVRLRKIASRSAFVIEGIVIDGNNMCYEQDTFIGLPALLTITRELSDSYPVTVVFDASIRRLLQMKDRDIAARFRNSVKVHVVATRTKADETILDTAELVGMVVISNDRFAEFPEKPVVRDQRLIRHEILNGKVFVHDLEIAGELQTA